MKLYKKLSLNKSTQRKQIKDFFFNLQRTIKLIAVTIENVGSKFVRNE